MMKKTADKNKAKELREELKDIINELSITQEEAADCIAEVLEINGFVESFKSDLKRCNNIGKLRNYICALKNSDIFIKRKNIRAKIEGDYDILGNEQKILHALSYQIQRMIDEKKSME
ncbi:hypothetical protein [Bisgaardia hudsonensis]|nr:hypothetical protein [Bisgaardia hudsonensis]